MGYSTNRLAGFAALLVGTVCISRPILASTVYEVGADFSATQNGGSNPWSYGYISDHVYTDLSDFTPFSMGTDLGGGSGEWTIGTNTDPNVYHNGGGAGGDSSFYVAPNAVILGPAFGPTVVEWTAPADGTINITSSGQDVQSCCGTRTVYYDVFVGGTDSGIQNVGPNPSGVDPSNLPTATYNASNIPVTKGEIIAFEAIGSTDGSTWNSMQLNATIDFTPEPASLALVGLGAMGLMSTRRRHNI